MSSDQDRTRGPPTTSAARSRKAWASSPATRSLESEGHMDQAKGKTQQALGDVKDALNPKR
jgi:hypothetical protein